MEKSKYIVIGVATLLVCLALLFIGYKINDNPIIKTEVVYKDSIVMKYDTTLVTDTLIKTKQTTITETVTVKNPLDSVLLNKLIVMQDSLKALGATQILTMDTTLTKNNITTSLVVKCDKIQNWISVLKYDMRNDTIHYVDRTITVKDNSFQWHAYGLGVLSTLGIEALIYILVK